MLCALPCPKTRAFLGAVRWLMIRCLPSSKPGSKRFPTFPFKQRLSFVLSQPLSSALRQNGKCAVGCTPPAGRCKPCLPSRSDELVWKLSGQEVGRSSEARGKAGANEVVCTPRGRGGYQAMGVELFETLFSSRSQESQTLLARPGQPSAAKQHLLEESGQLNSAALLRVLPSNLSEVLR